MEIQTSVSATPSPAKKRNSCITTIIVMVILGILSACGDNNNLNSNNETALRQLVDTYEIVNTYETIGAYESVDVYAIVGEYTMDSPFGNIEIISASGDTTVAFVPTGKQLLTDEALFNFFHNHVHRSGHNRVILYFGNGTGFVFFGNNGNFSYMKIDRTTGHSDYFVEGLTLQGVVSRYSNSIIYTIFYANYLGESIKRFGTINTSSNFDTIVSRDGSTRTFRLMQYRLGTECDRFVYREVEISPLILFIQGRLENLKLPEFQAFGEMEIINTIWNFTVALVPTDKQLLTDEALLHFFYNYVHDFGHNLVFLYFGNGTGFEFARPSNQFSFMEIDRMRGLSGSPATGFALDGRVDIQDNRIIYTIFERDHFNLHIINEIGTFSTYIHDSYTTSYRLEGMEENGFTYREIETSPLVLFATGRLEILAN